MGEITLVTDFFDIGRGQDKNEELRRTASKYFDEFKRWARIQNRLIVYTDSKSAETIAKQSVLSMVLQTRRLSWQRIIFLNWKENCFHEWRKHPKNRDFLNFRYLQEAFK